MYWARSRVLEYLGSAGATCPRASSPPRPRRDRRRLGLRVRARRRTGSTRLQRSSAASRTGPPVRARSGRGGRRGRVGRRLRARVPGRGRPGEAAGARRVAARRDARRRGVQRRRRRAEHRGRRPRARRARARLREEPRGPRAVPVKLGEDGTPVLVRDVGVVSFGPGAPPGHRRARRPGEVVGGIVIMRYGENALDVIEA
jgi:hypothetical protein